MHPSRIFALILAAFLLVVAYASLMPTQSQYLTYLIIGSGFVAVLFRRIKLIRIIALFILFIFLGLWRVTETTPKQNPNWINFYIGEEGTVKVRIIEEPKISGKFQQIVARPVDQNIKGNLQISTNQFPKYHFGDTLEVTGKIEDLKKDSEQYRGYFKSQNVFAFMQFPKITITDSSKTDFWDDFYFRARKPLVNVRLKYEEMIARLLPEPQAGLLSGILLGSRADLSSELLSWLSATGTTHIIALSGYNITIVVMFMTILMRNFSRRLSFVLPIVGILAFVMATGLSASVIRAAIMGFLLLLASRVGRQSDALVSVLFASAVMVFVTPAILLFDVGFQLSFAAVCGILFLAPKIEKYFAFLGKNFGTILAATLSAQLLSWPITSYYFGKVSFVAPLANLLILISIPYLMFAGFLIATIGFVSFWLAQNLSVILWAWLSYYLKVIETLAPTKYAASNYKITSGWLLLGYFLLMFDLVLILNRRRKPALRTKPE